jgi:hypothetical protein
LDGYQLKSSFELKVRKSPASRLEEALFQSIMTSECGHKYVKSEVQFTFGTGGLMSSIIKVQVGENLFFNC